MPSPSSFFGTRPSNGAAFDQYSIRGGMQPPPEMVVKCVVMGGVEVEEKEQAGCRLK